MNRDEQLVREVPKRVNLNVSIVSYFCPLPEKATTYTNNGIEMPMTVFRGSGIGMAVAARVAKRDRLQLTMLDSSQPRPALCYTGKLEVLALAIQSLSTFTFVPASVVMLQGLYFRTYAHM